MSHESVIASLKKLIKQELISIQPGEHAAHVVSESDRVSTILNAAMIEDFLLARLKRLMPSLNSDEQNRIFQFEGPCGSFSNRIRIAQGLGVIDRSTRRAMEMIKEMRNVAAHCHTPITFDTLEIREAVASLFKAEHRAAIVSWPREDARKLFEVAAWDITAAIMNDDDRKPNLDAVFEAVRDNELHAWPDI